ncbi:zf-TFIIB domain-containing protein [Variovorax sp. GB1P17]|uniref:zf-TFIIB domain-containing protein n=1 Tax=Variovorax sp. GB1P17 TaxID=3443740 RepID=UPI003F455D4A
MSSPLCPNCQERMSSVEHGMGGVWSCIYCEGTWLSRGQVGEIAHRFMPRAASSTSPPANCKAASFVCPACPNSCFEAGEEDGIYRCAACRSLFFERGVLAKTSPQKFSSDGEAPVAAALAGVIGSTLALDSLPLAVALQAKRPKGLA